MKHNSKLISLSKAIKNLNTDSKDLQKYAGFISLLAGAGKLLTHLAVPLITGHIGTALFESASEFTIKKTLGLPAAKSGFSYTVFFNSPTYKDSVKYFSLYSVVGLLNKDGQTSGIKDPSNRNIDQVNSDKVSIGRSISASGEAPPIGYRFAPIYGVIEVEPISGEPYYVAASGSVDAAGIFKMQVTDESIASTIQAFSEGKVENIKRETSKEFHPFGESFGAGLAEAFTGIGGQEIEYTRGLDSKETGKRDIIKGMGDIGSAVGLEAGVGLLGGGVGATLNASVGAVAGGTVGGATGGIGASIIGTTFGVAMPLAAAFSGGYAIGRGIDKYTGIGEGLMNWIYSPAAKEGKEYSLKIIAGKWAPHIKDFSISGVYGDLLDKAGKEVNPKYMDPTTNPVWVKSSAESKARGDKPKDGGLFVPNQIIGAVRFTNGSSLNIFASKITQSGTKTNAEINEADLTAKIAKNISLDRFQPIPGVELSGEEVSAANKIVQKNIVSSVNPKEQKPQATSGGAVSSEWSNYLAKTQDGDSMKRVWDRWSPTLGSSPDSFSGFVATWKQLKQLSGLKDLGVRNTSIMIQALGEGRESDSRSPDASNPEKNYSAAYSAIQSGNINAVSSLLKNRVS